MQMYVQQINKTVLDRFKFVLYLTEKAHIVILSLNKLLQPTSVCEPQQKKKERAMRGM